MNKLIDIINIKGCVSNSMYLFWASWSPPSERSTLLGISNSGSLIGNVFTFKFLIKNSKIYRPHKI